NGLAIFPYGEVVVSLHDPLADPVFGRWLLASRNARHDRRQAQERDGLPHPKPEPHRAVTRRALPTSPHSPILLVVRSSSQTGSVGLTPRCSVRPPLLLMVVVARWVEPRFLATTPTDTADNVNTVSGLLVPIGRFGLIGPQPRVVGGLLGRVGFHGNR